MLEICAKKVKSEREKSQIRINMEKGKGDYSRNLDKMANISGKTKGGKMSIFYFPWC